MTASIAFNDVMTALNIVTGKYVVEMLTTNSILPPVPIPWNGRL